MSFILDISLSWTLGMYFLVSAALGVVVYSSDVLNVPDLTTDLPSAEEKNLPYLVRKPQAEGMYSISNGTHMR
jgi:hypothetical protein